ncbi:hypothetical protein C8R43DRAFT_972993 [Mycena crocata]|nr:hypothetical protein C8R43DRAFT_972993 [Mycena crocata]
MATGMDKGTKRKRDSAIPTLVYSAPGYSRFAKLFTESSLEEIKEIVRKRLELSSVSDFTLFYDSDIALENDDDFDAFEVHAHSAGSSVNVVVKILSQVQVSPPNVAGPSTVEQNSTPTTTPTNLHSVVGTAPPRKRRKVAVDVPQPESISLAPKQKPMAALIGEETASTIPVAANEAPEASEAKSNRKKKKKSQNMDSVPPDSTAPATVSGAKRPPDSSADGQGQPKKKAKNTEKDSATTPKPSGRDGASKGNKAPEPHAGSMDKAKSAKEVEKGPADAPLKSAAPKPSVIEGVSEKSFETAPPKSKKSTQKSKKDAQPEGVPTADDQAQNPVKSVKFSLPEQVAQTISAPTEPAPIEGEPVSAPKRRKSVNADPSNEKVKPPKGKKKAAKADLKDVESREKGPSDAEVRAKEYLKSLVQKLPVAPIPAVEPDPTADKAVKPASSRGRKPTIVDSTTMPCPVCQKSPFHLRYRCPVVLSGSGPIIKRIAELEKDAKTDHSQLIQELHGLAEKSQKGGKGKDLNVNENSSVLAARAEKGGVSDPSVHVAGHKLMAPSLAGSKGEGGNSSSDDSDSAASTVRKMVPPRPVDSYGDAELDAIIRGPSSARLTVDDILFEEEQDDGAESVVLENDDDEDIKSRRRSRNLEVAASSGEEDEGDEDEDFPSGEIATLKSLPVINVSVRADSGRSTRSPTEPLTSLDARESADVEPSDDTAVADAMASDNVIFSLETPDEAANPDIAGDRSPQSTRTTPSPLTPKPTPPSRIHISETAPVLDDFVRPAGDSPPPTPVQQNKLSLPITPSTPRLSQRTKDRNGKLPPQPDPASVIPEIQPQPAESTQTSVEDSVEDARPQRTRTRSSTRMTSVAPPSSEVQQPPKRKRAPNKTPEQRAQEAALKLAAKEERERVRKENSQAKAAGKKGPKVVESTMDGTNCPPPSSGLPEATPPPEDSTPRGEPAELCTLPAASRTPMSQDEWTVLKRTSPEEYRDQDSLRDELCSSSPEPRNDKEEAPLFFPAESQVPFPYSQWNSIPEDVSPDSPKESEDEEDEEEVAASIKSSQRPSVGSYRRLTDIASQPALFSVTPPLRVAAAPATFPRGKAKDKRAELYGALPQDDDDSSDSDSSGGELPSHIPKSRRAGMATRQR